MPIDRRDVLEVLAMQDKVAGACRDVAGIISGRNMTLPESMRDGFMELVATCIAAVEKAAASIQELDELIETGFDKSERELVSNTLSELDSVEHRTDEQAAALSRLLFELEDQLPPVHVVFLYRVIDKTAGIADRAQRVGSRLQLMLAR
jgi:predicted phosphate transport protein (TIGR00153 family)